MGDGSKRYKIVVSDGVELSIYTTKAYEEDEHFITFSDKYGVTYRVNKNNVIKIVEYKDKGEGDEYEKGGRR